MLKACAARINTLTFHYQTERKIWILIRLLGDNLEHYEYATDMDIQTKRCSNGQSILCAAIIYEIRKRQKMDLQHVDAEQFSAIDCLNTDAPQTCSIADKSNALCMSLPSF